MIGPRIPVLCSIVLFAGFVAIAACSSDSTDTASGTDSANPAQSSSSSSGTNTSSSGSTGPLPARCTDGIKNANETDIDCGGSCAKCPPTKMCTGAMDCDTSLCVGGVCYATGPMNGVQDGTETDADCGGSAAPACVDGKQCAAKTDCASGVCTTGVCAAPTKTDGSKNGTETDVDCGGGAPTNAPKCDAEKKCAVNGDCRGDTCERGTCVPTPSDGAKNGTETDIDCGGGMAPTCDDGKTCVAPTDCKSASCTAGTCVAPTKSDGVKNGTETDVDCGGGAPTNAPPCVTDKGCTADTDCENAACGTVGTLLAGKCLAGRSCSGGLGAGNACGVAGADNCCQTLAVPGGRFRRTLDNSLTNVSSFYLDKYEITQGRFRQFMKAMNGNPATNFPAYVTSHPGAGTHPKVAGSGWRNSFNVRLPRNWDEAKVRFTIGCSDGGNNADGGAATWTDNAAHDTTANDEKSMTCADWYSLYAFCAWDGGFLPTDAQWNFAAAGGDQQRQYAWKENGDTTKPDYADVPVGQDPNNYLVNGFKIGEYVAHAFCIPAYPSCFSVGTPYRVAGDGPAHVSAPGMKKDVGRWGHHDFGGNLIEWLLDEKYPYGNSTDPANVAWPDPPQGVGELGKNPPQWRNPGHEFDGAFHPDGGRVMRGGSWERHEYVQGPRVRAIYTEYPVFRSYYAVGARCARARQN